MTPEAITALRKQLKCTVGELAAALGVEHRTVLAWEHDELFPTKRFVDAMEALRAQGPGAVVRRRPGSPSASPMDVLSDPSMWRLVRKLIAHEQLRAAVEELAASYDDPGA